MPTAVRGSARRHALRSVAPLRTHAHAHTQSSRPVPGAPPSDAIAAAWRAWRDHGSLAARNRLVQEYMATLVRPISVRVHGGLPHQVELDDLIQQGYLGLVDAMDRFCPERGVRFETYARPRIFGALTDYLRTIDTVPRLTRTRSKTIQHVIDSFQMQFGRPPSTDDLRRIMNLPEADFRRHWDDRDPRSTLCFSTAAPEHDGDDDDDADAMGAFLDRREVSPDRSAQRGDLLHWICRGFDPRDRLIIILYYYEHMTMREVGIAAGISESRVSQRLESILDCLRSRLSEEWFAGQV